LKQQDNSLGQIAKQQENAILLMERFLSAPEFYWKSDEGADQ